MPIVESKLKLFETEEKTGLGATIALNEPLLGSAPKALQPVDVDSAGEKSFAVVDFQVPGTAKYQAIITAELSGIGYAAPPDGPDRAQTFGQVSTHDKFNCQVLRPDPLLNALLNCSKSCVPGPWVDEFTGAVICPRPLSIFSREG
jgi:hypothetical protein